MELTGVGTFLLEDSAWYSYSPTTPLLYLRADYGYHWDGDIVIKNNKSYVYPDATMVIAHYFYTNWYFGYTAKFPNITVDGATYYDIKTDKQLPAGFDNVSLFPFREGWTKMHLSDAGVPSIFAVIDDDGDGYIDEPRFLLDAKGTLSEPIDLDGDGKIGNTSLKYSDYFDDKATIKNPTHWRGVEHPTCTANLNMCAPPAYFKVINNKNKDGETICHYHLMDTSKEGISDGGWYRDADAPDSLGGYFGGTKFIYGDGEKDFFVGTKNTPTETDTFVFDSEYYVPPHLRKN